MQSSQPIGIFDSGIGGLTVAHEIAKLLPHENLLYFGDTAHLPYGDKSPETIQQYCIHILDFLLSKKCKLIVVACYSATTTAYEAMLKHLNGRVPLLGVVDPVVQFLAENYRDKTLGLIGTKRTVASGVFEKKINALPNHLQLKSLATPLLVPLIEEDFHRHQVLVDETLRLYLSQPQLSGIEALILACTHYPVVKSRVEAFYQHKIPVLDAGVITAQALQKILSETQALNPQQGEGDRKFYVSDITPAFAQMASQFFGEKVSLIHE